MSRNSRSALRPEHLGIVIVHFGEKFRTYECLDSFIRSIMWLKKYKPDIMITILVIDNSGNLDLRTYNIGNDIEIRIFKPKRNLGYAGACYIATNLIRSATLFIFSNNDIILREDSLSNLIKAMEALPDAGLIQPLVIAKGSSKIDSMGSTCSTIMHGFNYANWPIKPIGRFSIREGLDVMEVFGVDGMFFMLKREVWEKTGGWDPIFFMFNEDGLLSWKSRLMGYKNYVVLNSVTYHERGGTAKGYFIKRDPIFPSYYISRNKILSILYVYDGAWLILYFFASILFEFIKNVMLSLRNRSALSIYHYLKALKFVLSNSRHIITERAKVHRKINPKYFLKNGYILSLSTSLALILRHRRYIFQ